MVEMETAVYYVDYGLKRRIYKTARQPTRFYYLVENRQMYVDSDEIPNYMKQHITIKNKKGR